MLNGACKWGANLASVVSALTVLGELGGASAEHGRTEWQNFDDFSRRELFSLIWASLNLAPPSAPRFASPRNWGHELGADAASLFASRWPTLVPGIIAFSRLAGRPACLLAPRAAGRPIRWAPPPLRQEP